MTDTATSTYDPARVVSDLRALDARTGGEGPQQLQAAHHPQGAVEPAALRHGVEVAADDERLRRRPAQHGPQVPGGVGVDLDGQRGQ